MKNKVISAPDAPVAIGPYSAGILVENNNLIFVSGQLPVDPKTNEIISEDVKEQTLQSLKNMEAVLKAANKNRENVCKTTVFLANINDFQAMNEVYAEFFGENKPARSAFQVAALPKNAKVEIEVVAA